MTVDIPNRYANYDLHIATQYHERLDSFVSHSGKEKKLFSRWVDAWWLALTIGVRVGRRSPLPPNVTKFYDGRILSSDPWRITHLELLALAENGPEALDDPRDVIRMASEYANTGFPDLLDHVVGQNEPTLHLISALSRMGQE